MKMKMSKVTKYFFMYFLVIFYLNLKNSLFLLMLEGIFIKFTFIPFIYLMNNNFSPFPWNISWSQVSITHWAHRGTTYIVAIAAVLCLGQDNRAQRSPCWFKFSFLYLRLVTNQGYSLSCYLPTTRERIDGYISFLKLFVNKWM